MRYIATVMLIIAGFVTAGWAATGDNLTQQPITYDAPNAIVYHPELPANDLARFSPTHIGSGQLPMPLERKPEAPPRIMWGTDVQITGVAIRTPKGVDMQSWTGTPIYTAVCRSISSGSGDTLWVFRSTDNGYTWSPFGYYYSSVVGDRMSSANLVIGTGGNSEIWAGAIYTSGTNHGDLVIGRWNTSGTFLGFNWPRGSGNADTVAQMSMARSNDNAWAATIMFQQTTGAGTDPLINHLTTTDFGTTWVYGPNRSGSHDPHLAFGNAGLAIFTYRSDFTGQGIGLQRSTNNGASWSGSLFITTDPDSSFEPRIALDHVNPIASQVGWIIYRFSYSTSDQDIYYAYTTDGGATWTGDNGLAASTSNELLPDIFCAPESPSNFVRATYETYAGGDHIAYQSASASAPTTWSSPVWISDYTPTGTTPAHPGSNGAGNGCVVYEGVGPTAAWFDYFNFTGVEEGNAKVTPQARLTLGAARPSVLSRSTSIAFSLPKSGSVDLAVYDIAGRKVATLAQGTMSAGSHEVSWNGAKAPAGVYLYRLSFEGKTLTNRMVVVR